MQMFHRIQEDERCLDSVIFSDDSTFHVSGGERVLHPKQRKSVWSLRRHGDDHYRYSVSGHAPTFLHSTIRLR
jgi:hypothetical protein